MLAEYFQHYVSRFLNSTSKPPSSTTIHEIPASPGTLGNQSKSVPWVVQSTRPEGASIIRCTLWSSRKGKTDLVQISSQELERESGLKSDELSAMLVQMEEKGAPRRIKESK